MREQKPTVSFTEVLRQIVINYSASDPIVHAALAIQRFWRQKKRTELLKSRHLGEAIETKIKQRWPHVQLIVHVRQHYFLSRLPKQIREQVGRRLLIVYDPPRALCRSRTRFIMCPFAAKRRYAVCIFSAVCLTGSHARGYSLWLVAWLLGWCGCRWRRVVRRV